MGAFLILLAGCFWGSMGLFSRWFYELGFTPLQTAAIRLTFGALVLLVGISLVRPSLLKIRGKDFPLLAASGILSIACMSGLYLTTISLSSLSVAAVLLYISPVAVMLMSAVWLKEKITGIKMVALVLAVAGCVLVAGLAGGEKVSVTAVLTGIGSAVAYGSYSIFGTKAMKRYHPFTVTTWSFCLAAVALIAMCNPVSLVATVQGVANGWLLLLMCFGIGTVTAVIPFSLYTLGLWKTEASKAAVLACSEPAAATVFGMVFYGEIPSVLGFVGMSLIAAAIVLLSSKNKNE